MNEVLVARALHVAGVVLWIGGVGFVTTVLLPAIRRMADDEGRVALFEQLEGRFAWQARATTLVVGISGFYITYEWDLWARFTSASYWWMHAMVVVWGLFSAVLFVAEPLFLHSWFQRKATEAPTKTFRLIELFHWILLTVSLLAVLGAVAGSHGLLI